MKAIGQWNTKLILIFKKKRGIDDDRRVGEELFI